MRRRALLLVIVWIAAFLQLAQRAAAAAADLSPRQDAPLPAPVAPAAKLTLAQALAIGRKQNPQVLQASAQTASARYNAASQRAPLSGSLAFSGLNNTVAIPDFGSGANYVLYLPVETSGRFLYRGGQARAQLQGTQEDQRTADLAVRQSVTSAYIGLQVADEVLGSERAAYASANQLARLTQSQFQLGAAREADAIRARIAFVQEGQNLAQAVAAVLTARASLNLALGRPASTPIDAADALREPEIPETPAGSAGDHDAPARRTLAAGDASPALDRLQRQALDSRPEIRSSQAGERAQHQATRLAQAQYLPDLILGKDFSGSRQIFVGFTVPLPDFGATHYAIQKARADERVQHEQTDQARQQALADVQTAYISLQESLDAVASYQTGILPQSESLLRRVEQGYALGASTILDVIDAQNTYRTTHDSYYAALGAYRQAVAQLERAVGGTVPASVLRGETGVATADAANAANAGKR